MTDVSGIDKVVLLKALWENQVVAAFFSMNGIPPPPFDDELAKASVSKPIDYFCGRAIKTDLSKDMIDFWLYDRDAPVKAADIVKELKT